MKEANDLGVRSEEGEDVHWGICFVVEGFEALTGVYVPEASGKLAQVPRNNQASNSLPLS